MSKVKTYRINVDSTTSGDAIVIGSSGAMTGTHLGTAASLDTGSSAGNIPVLDSDGKLGTGVIPDLNIPTKVSDLQNDTGFITSSSLPTKVSDLTNDSGFITNSVNDLTNYYTKTSTDTLLNAKADTDDIPAVVNNVTSTSTDSALSANMGKELQEQIDTLKAIGRFLSIWNCTTGLPYTNPTTSPYTYHSGDYYLIGTVGTTNYKPSGTQYVTGEASSTVETETVNVGDSYVFDGTNWALQINTTKTVTFSALGGSPYDNTNLSNALNSKANTSAIPTKVSDLQNDTGFITSSAISGKVDSTSAGSKVYGTTDTGTQTTYSIDVSATANTIALRDSNGRLTVATPSSNSDATTKAYVDNGLANKANSSDISTVGTTGLYSDLLSKPTIPTKTSDLTNDSGFVTSSALSGYESTSNKSNVISAASTTTQYPTSAAVYQALLNAIGSGGNMVKLVYDPNNKSADAFDYDNFINTPTIPSKTSDLTNDSGFVTSSAIPSKTSDLTNDSGFITNSVNSLTNYPLTTTVDTALARKQPVINDLVTIRSGAALGTTSIQPDDNISELTNDAGYITSSSLPTKTSDLTNDSGFITNSYHDSTKQDTISDLATIRSGASAGATALQKTTAVSDSKGLYNGQNVNAIINKAGFSSSSNLLASDVNVAIRSNSSNPFIGLQDSTGTKYYMQETGGNMYFGPTSAVAMKFDASGNATFQGGSVTAKSGFIKTGGTSSQFLKADGSVDSNAYITSSYHDSTKQDTLTAGTNINISGTTISATDTTYTASDFDIKDLADSTSLRTTWNAKQDALPTVVNDRYLHTNSSTGALEWSEVSSGGITIDPSSPQSFSTERVGTQAQYDAIATKSAGTKYLIIE